MLFRESSIRGVFTIDPEPRADERGFFARTWCQREFDDHGLSGWRGFSGMIVWSACFLHREDEPAVIRTIAQLKKVSGRRTERKTCAIA